MNWQTIEFYDELLGDKDVLGNRQPVPILIGVYMGQLLPWNTEEILMLDKPITQTQQKLMSDAPLSVLESAKFIKVNDQNYSVMKVKKANARWRVCHVKEYFV